MDVRATELEGGGGRGGRGEEGRRRREREYTMLQGESTRMNRWRALRLPIPIRSSKITKTMAKED